MLLLLRPPHVLLPASEAERETSLALLLQVCEDPCLAPLQLLDLSLAIREVGLPRAEDHPAQGVRIAGKACSDAGSFARTPGAVLLPAAPRPEGKAKACSGVLREGRKSLRLPSAARLLLLPPALLLLSPPLLPEPKHVLLPHPEGDGEASLGVLSEGSHDAVLTPPQCCDLLPAADQVSPPLRKDGSGQGLRVARDAGDDLGPSACALGLLSLPGVLLRPRPQHQAKGGDRALGEGRQDLRLLSILGFPGLPPLFILASFAVLEVCPPGPQQRSRQDLGVPRESRDDLCLSASLTRCLSEVSNMLAPGAQGQAQDHGGVLGKLGSQARLPPFATLLPCHLLLPGNHCHRESSLILLAELGDQARLSPSAILLPRHLLLPCVDSHRGGSRVLLSKCRSYLHLSPFLQLQPLLLELCVGPPGKE
mmetsp:Transcript_51108/g.148363  ORF Transcript_51108/g.148363 Transcript_51108/m.148363 type:complete len:423 (-) Transcript_51108:1122-2390(-)